MTSTVYIAPKQVWSVCTPYLADVVYHSTISAGRYIEYEEYRSGLFVLTKFCCCLWQVKLCKMYKAHCTSFTGYEAVERIIQTQVLAFTGYKLVVVTDCEIQ